MSAHLNKKMRQYIFDALNRIWGWDSERKKAKQRAIVGRGADFKEQYRCEGCGNQPLGRTEVQIDHIIPRMPPTGWDGDWQGYIDRTFVLAEGLRVICKPCHKPKTNAENSARRAAKKAASK